MKNLIPISILCRGKTVVNQGWKASSFLSRLKGLLGTQNLHEGHGLFIPKCKQVHTFFMKYPIDVLFLDSKNKIVKSETLAPWKISSLSLKAASVLELPAGYAQKHQLTNGETLEVHTR